MARYFEHKDEKSNKFWEVSSSGKKMTVRYGKIGVVGQTLVKEFPNSTVASAEVDKAIAKKIKEGYKEKSTVARTQNANQKPLTSLRSKTSRENTNKNPLEGIKKIEKISVYLSKISEKETMFGIFHFKKGKSKEGWSVNNNALSGSLPFTQDSSGIPISEFIERIMDNEWTQYIPDYIDNFEGQGKSIDYEFEDFESYDEGNTDDCEYDADQDPSQISIFFAKSKIDLMLDAENQYSADDVQFTREQILSIVKSIIS